MQAVLLFDKTNEPKMKEKVLWSLSRVPFKLADPLEPPFPNDLIVHIDVPIYGWMPWAPVNILAYNPETYMDAWTPYLSRFDAVVFEHDSDRQRFQQQHLSVTTWTLEQLSQQIYLPKARVQLPPSLPIDKCPPISIITLLYNRRKFFELACHNIMLSDYPKDKIEWVIVEDSDDINEDASDRVVQVAMKASPVNVIYIPLDKKTPIGEKRNLGIKKATNNVILMMDDDDHYPTTSFRRRVSWLLMHPWKPRVTSCTTIACYDLVRGVSAVNTPAFTLPLRQRISEATLCFYKNFWEEKGFPSSSMSEGEGFLEGRELDVLELPPQQIIVALSHKKNISGRRVIAPDAKPGCFWGFPKEFLVFLHSLADIQVESV